MNSRTLLIGSSALALGILIAMLACSPALDRAETPPVLIYCGAEIRSPIDAAAKEYEKDYGVPIVFQYGPSQTLVVQADVSRASDLILPGDDTFLDRARERGLIDQAVPLARMVPVLAVAKGNPKRVPGRQRTRA